MWFCQLRLITASRYLREIRCGVWRVDIVQQTLLCIWIFKQVECTSPSQIPPEHVGQANKREVPLHLSISSFCVLNIFCRPYFPPISPTNNQHPYSTTLVEAAWPVFLLFSSFLGEVIGLNECLHAILTQLRLYGSSPLLAGTGTIPIMVFVDLQSFLKYLNGTARLNPTMFALIQPILRVIRMQIYLFPNG